MAAVLKPGTTVQKYKIVELVGDGTQSNVYLASADQQFYWLIQIEAADWDPGVNFAHVERFDADSGQWAALGISGTGMVHLASWLDRLELPFVGWRWAKLARQVGYLHQKGRVLGKNQTFSLERLVFNRDGELILANDDPGRADQYVFPSPEAAQAASPASDVYSLAASLNALAGDELPRGVKNVLQRAMNADPAKRYADGIAFSDALAQQLPDPNREKLPLPPPKTRRLVPLAGLGLALVIFAALGVFLYTQVNPARPEPTAVAAKQIPIRVTIVKWQVQPDCTARVQVRVQDGEQTLAAKDVQFSALTPQATINEIGFAPGADSGESVLTFPLGEYCKAGGALTVRAKRDTRQGESIVYYYPGNGDPTSVALFKTGSRQTLVNQYPHMRLYFGLSNADGSPANLKGAIRVRVLQDGAIVHDLKMRAVNGDTDPLVAVFVIDTSKSMTGDALANAQKAADNFISKLGDRDFVCVYRFSTTVSAVHVCSTDHKQATEAIDKLTAGGNTALYDVMEEVSKAYNNPQYRQAIILLSDGGDNNSKTERQAAVNDLARTNIPVYAIGLVSHDLTPAILREISSRTGGEYLESPTPNDLTKLYESVYSKLESQYAVEFDSLYPDRKSGTIELLISDGDSEISIKKDFQAQ